MTVIETNPPVASSSRKLGARGPQRFVGEPSQALPLIALTALAAVLHFSFLNRPCLWHDEGLTYARLGGSLGQLFESLRSAGFGPLHFVIQWLISRIIGLRPAGLRLFPAACGTLMVPAMYALTARLIDRKTALRVAAFTAVSAFLFEFSRDAKMYMPFWLFIAVHFACLLKWIDDGRRRSWLAWVASGAVLLLIHAPGLILLAMEPAALALGERRARQRWVAFLVGVALLLMPMAAYHIAFDQFGKSIHDNGWEASGLGWIGSAIAGHSGAALTLNVQCALLTGWSWIHAGVIPRPILASGLFIFVAMLLGGAIGVVPWRSNAEAIQPAPRTRRAALLIAIWIVVPFYLFYCTSVRGAAAPFGGFVVLGSLAWWWLTCRPELQPAAGEKLGAICIAAAAMGICLTAWIVCRIHPLKPIWVTRYLGFTWPAVAIAVCALTGRIPWALPRHGLFALLLAGNLGQSIAWVFVPNEPPRDRIAQDIVQSQGIATQTRAYVNPACYDPGRFAASTLNAAARIYLFQAAHLSVTPDEFYNLPLEHWFVLRTQTELSSVAADIANAPNVKQIVIWDSLPRDDWDEHLAMDQLLGSGWKRESAEIIPVREGATWAHYFNYRRLCYVRVRG